MIKRFYSPSETYYILYKQILDGTHTLIAGTTGSGKSVLMSGLICTLMQTNAPPQAEYILIDPKRVELSPYQKTFFCKAYANDITAFNALDSVIKLMESRYIQMEQEGIRKWNGASLYVFIDEFADLMLTNKKQCEMKICRIAQLGRAAGIHLIIATQRPTRDIITGTIKCNLDTRIALRCPSAQDSRNIIGINGAESLPKYGQGYILNPDGLTLWNIPMIEEETQNRLIDYWSSKRCYDHKSI